MVKSVYLGESLFFETFEECKEYYGHDTASSIEELNDILECEYCGMVSPVIIEI